MSATIVITVPQTDESSEHTGSASDAKCGLQVHCNSSCLHPPASVDPDNEHHIDLQWTEDYPGTARRYYHTTVPVGE